MLNIRDDKDSKTVKCILMFLLMVFIPSFMSAEESNSVLIVVNDNSTDSIDVGRYYQKERNVPESNVCHIKTTATHSISLEKYSNEVLKPVRNSLKSGISYILMTYDTPFRLKINNKYYSLDAFLCFPYENISEENLVNYAGDQNPYYNKGTHFIPNGKYFLVVRIDGPNPEIAKGLVDKALYGEKHINTKYGKCYFDARGSNSTDGYYQHDSEIIEAYNTVKSKGYDCILDKNPKEFSEGDCPDVLFYWGWYSVNNYINAFIWKEGAVGIHTDSFSASNIRTGSCWVVRGLQQGLTATLGAVNEPYLHTYTRPNLFFKYFLNGYNFAEAAYIATPVSKWMMCMIGDPLYNPSKGAKKQ